MTFNKVLDRYSDEQVHDGAPVWDSVHRRWYGFSELKVRVVAAFQTQRVRKQVRVKWMADWTESELPADDLKGLRRGVEHQGGRGDCRPWHGRRRAHGSGAAVFSRLQAEIKPGTSDNGA